MNSFLEMVLDSIIDRIEKMLREAFEAGKAHAQDDWATDDSTTHPDFDEWLAAKRATFRGE